MNHLIMGFVGCFEMRARRLRRERETVREEEVGRLRALETRVLG
jgi:hypothetical protein